MVEGKKADPQVNDDQGIVGDGRQFLVYKPIFMHAQDLHRHRDRHESRHEFARASEACVKVPAQPDEHDDRKQESHIPDSGVPLELLTHLCFSLLGFGRFRRKALRAG
jgi:hypothetical protein